MIIRLRPTLSRLASPHPGWICAFCSSLSQPASKLRNRRQYSTPTTDSTSPEIFDVVIVGGGPAGLTLATALKSSSITRNLKVALIEGQSLLSSKEWSPKNGEFSNRVSSLTPKSVQFMQNIGAWHHFDHSRCQTYNQMQVWDGISNQRIEFDWNKLSRFSSPPNSETIAVMVENFNTTHALMSRLYDGTVETPVIYDETKVESIAYGQDNEEADLTEWPVVQLSNNRTLAARLLIGADGANSPVRTFAEIESRGWDYGRHGLVATLRISDPQLEEFERIAYQRFLPTGPVALLPLPGNYATLVWSTTPENAAQLKRLDEGEFVAMVNAAFRLEWADLGYLHTGQASSIAEEVEWRMGVTQFPEPPLVPTSVLGVQEGSRASFPLKMRHADSYIAPRVALLGDAAHTVHPLAGQGLNSGLGDAESLIKTLEYAVLHGQDVGSVLSLEAYESDRYVKNNALLGVVDKLHMVYGTENKVVVGLRTLGQKFVDGDWVGIKGFFMKQAAGSS